MQLAVQPSSHKWLSSHHPTSAVYSIMIKNKGCPAFKPLVYFSSSKFPLKINRKFNRKINREINRNLPFFIVFLIFSFQSRNQSRNFLKTTILLKKKWFSIADWICAKINRQIEFFSIEEPLGFLGVSQARLFVYSTFSLSGSGGHTISGKLVSEFGLFMQHVCWDVQVSTAPPDLHHYRAASLAHSQVLQWIVWTCLDELMMKAKCRKTCPLALPAWYCNTNQTLQDRWQCRTRSDSIRLAKGLCWMRYCTRRICVPVVPHKAVAEVSK